MRDIDRVIALLDECVRDCDRAYRFGDGLTHTTTGQVQHMLEEAREILQAWPAKVYAIGVQAPAEEEQDAQRG